MPDILALTQSDFSHERRKRGRSLLTRAAEIADSFTERAIRHQEEADLWRWSTRLAEAMLNLGDETEHLAEVYHRAANLQFTQDNLFRTVMTEWSQVVDRIRDQLTVFTEFSRIMIERFNWAAEEAWWPNRALSLLDERKRSWYQLINAGYPLITFERFLHDPPATPTRVMWR